MEKSRLIDNRHPELEHLRALDPELPDHCWHIITGYSPNQPSSAWLLVRDFVIECVVAMHPRTYANARRLMTMTALYVTWVWTATGCELTAARVFNDTHLRRYLAVRLAKHSDMYRFDTARQLSTMAELLTGAHLARLATPYQAEAVAPHTRDDIARLRSWANTLSTPFKRQNARALLALAAGAGLTSQQIVDAQVEDVEFADGRAFVSIRERQGSRVPMRAAWVRMLNEAIGTRRTGDIFQAYRFEEYPPNQLHQFLTRNRGELRPSVSRLRSGWIVALINANLPIDVLLDVAGFTTPHSLRPYLRYARSNSTAEWLPAITGEISA